MSLRCYRVSLGLVALVTMLLIVLTGSGHAQLNCKTTQCVEIRYAAVSATDNRNKYCYMSLVTRSGETYYVSYAYSGQYAVDNCYGQNSVGGSSDPASTTNGNWRTCDGAADCTGGNLSPVSGTASNYSDKTVNSNFRNKCDKPE